jgi:hypothetical protein
VKPAPDWYPLDMTDAVTLPPVVLHRIETGATVVASCECGRLIVNGPAYAYDIGGGEAYACASCALKSIGDGSAVLSGGGQ